MAASWFLQFLIMSSLMIKSLLSAPNFLFVITDDQDLLLESSQATPKVLERIAGQGITMEKAFAASPVCCASRTETLAGRTFHNIEATKLGETGCQKAAAHYTLYDNPNSLFQKFHSNGYVTGAFGKVVNNVNDYWCDSNEHSGFDRIHISCEYSDFYGTEYYNKYVDNDEGVTTNHDLTADVYQTTMMENAAVEFVRDRMIDERPFIAWLGPYAPHTSATPSELYADEFNDLTLLETPNYNEVCPDHHSPVGNNQLLGNDAQTSMLQLYKDRLRSLKSVDDMVDSILDVLDEYNDDNTYIIYTSDHGYQIGQYAIPCGKMQPYDVTTRIPLYIKGPNIPNGITSNNIVGNIDFLPTMLDLADISYDVNNYDGRSMKNILFGQDTDWRNTYLLEFKSVGTFGITHCPTWYPDDSATNPFVPGQVQKPSSSSTSNLIDNEDTNNWRVLRIIDDNNDLYYAEFYGINNVGFTSTPIDYEYFDLSSDPWQMNNIYSSLSDDEKTNYNQLLQAYGQCSGADQCSPVGDNTPPPYDGTTNQDTDNDNDGDDTGSGKTRNKGGKAMKDDAEKYDDGESVENVYKVIVENAKDIMMDTDNDIYVHVYGYGKEDVKVLQTKNVDQDNLEWNDQTFVFDDKGENGVFKEFKFKLYQIEVVKEDEDELFIDTYLGQTDGFKASDIKQCDIDYSKEMSVYRIDQDDDDNVDGGTLFVTIYKDC